MKEINDNGNLKAKLGEDRMKIEIFEDLQRVRMSPRSESCFSPETCNPL